MKVNELLKNENFTLLNKDVDTNKVITSGYVCDLLSWAMANAKKGCAWVTVQTNINVIAIAHLHEMSCVIVTDSMVVKTDILKRATMENIPLITTKLNNYDVVKFLIDNDVR